MCPVDWTHVLDLACIQVKMLSVQVCSKECALIGDSGLLFSPHLGLFWGTLDIGLFGSEARVS